MADQALTITWLGHGTFLFETLGGKRVLLDPWIEGNPSFPEGWRERLESGIDAILITHGHFDHIGDLVTLATKQNPTVVCIYDIVPWLEGKGLSNVVGVNKGGTVEVAGIKVTMTDARHSSSIFEDGQLVYLGEPAGYIIQFEDGYRVYHTGDTSVFGDMQLMGELYRPDMVIMPIGGWFTMDPFQAAHAARLIGAPRVIPEHYGTFPILNGTPDELRSHAKDLGLTLDVIALDPGGSWSPEKR